MKTPFVTLSIMFAIFALSGCKDEKTKNSDADGGADSETDSDFNSDSDMENGELSYTYDSSEPIIKVESDADIADITINGLSGQSVYLMMMNVSSEETDSAQSYSGYKSASSISGANAQLYSGYKSASSISGANAQTGNTVSGSSDRRLVSGHFKGVKRRDYPAAVEFNNNPPARISTASDIAPRSSDDAKLEIDSSTRDFWVEYNTDDAQTNAEQNYEVAEGIVDDNDDDGSDGWLRLTATLRGQSDHANVWIIDEYYDNLSESDTDAFITSEQAEKVAEVFDAVYYPETNILGYEYGGGPDGDGGRDGETRVNILIYDLYFDASDDQSDGHVGYFWGKDHYSTEQLSSWGYSYKSNYSEIFYIDSLFMDTYAGITYSTLAHEYQHMIHFNEKYLKKNVTSSTWFNEMLSLVTEDMMASYLEDALGDDYSADENGPVASWMSYFNYYYWSYGVTDWDDTYGYTYATAYAFGAYLARNYGGAEFIKELASNAYADEASVTAALKALDCDETTFDEAFERYGEAVVYSSSAFSDGKVPADIHTFDRTDSCTIDNEDNGESYEYTLDGFDIWDMANAGAGYEYFDGYSCPETGPTFIDVALTGSLSGYGLMGQSGDSLKNIDGSVSFSALLPTDENVVLYLMIR